MRLSTLKELCYLAGEESLHPRIFQESVDESEAVFEETKFHIDEFLKTGRIVPTSGLCDDISTAPRRRYTDASIKFNQSACFYARRKEA